MKSYDGLLQSGFMFFMQLVVLFTRPSIGTLYGIPDGRCKQLTNILSMPFSVWILVIGLISSLLNLLRDVTLYHIVSDGEASNVKRQIKLVPYYLVHLAFRSLALATFFIYWKVSFENVKNFVHFNFSIFEGGGTTHNCVLGHLQHVVDATDLQHKL